MSGVRTSGRAAALGGWWLAVGLLLSTWGPPGVAQQSKPDESGRDDDYNQWKLSLGAGEATDPATFTVPAGFQIDLVRSAGREDGSWIALAFDERGRAIVSREDQGLLRLTWDDAPSGGPPAAVRIESIETTLRECRGLLWAHGALYANANNSKGLYRLRDTDGDDRFDEVRLLRETQGGVGHGRNDLALGPDGLIYSIHGDDVRLPADYEPESSPLRPLRDRRLYPCEWDANLFNAAMVLPGGHLVRTDADGKRWEVVAGGLRNPYGIDFNADGEPFTYDADMEWDVGTPWYRPTRVLHLVSGADYGWRHGTGAWPNWYPDSPPTTLDVGLGSPTAVRFGTKTRFPDRYRRALFIADWSYGRILAVHLTPRGAGYSAETTPFVSGRPLNVTDLEVGPDGALYFLTGGRRTQSGLYRIRAVAGALEAAQRDEGAAPTAEALEAARAARERRRRLEAFHQRIDPAAVDAAWEELGGSDPWLTHAARRALERQPTETWLPRLFEAPAGRAKIVGLLAAAGVAPDWATTPIVHQLRDLPWAKLEVEDRRTALRALTLALARDGGREAAMLRAGLLRTLEPLYPASTVEENHLLCELLASLDSPQATAKTLALLATARSQEEKLRYLYVLRNVRRLWTSGERRQYFEGLRQAREFYGAQLMPRFIAWIKADAERTLTESERAELADLLRDEPAPAEPPTPLVARPHVRAWALQDLVGSLDWKPAERDLERGRRAYSDALCIKCHRTGTAGTAVGPDLQAVSRRFGRREMLLSILHPSAVIDEKFQAVAVTTSDGRVLVGQRIGGGEQEVVLLPDPLLPERVVKIAKSDVETLQTSHVSPMPAGLLNTLTKAEILDLLAYLESLAGR